MDERRRTDDEIVTVSPRHLVTKRWGWLAAALILVVLAWLLTRAMLGGRDATWTRIRETGVWRVGMDPSFPPFEDLDPATQRPVGFDVDLAQAIATRWGVRAEIVGVGFDQLLDAVAAHRVDSAISAHPVIPHRAKDVAFSPPYFEAGVLLAVPAGSPITGPGDLTGKRVAAEWGSEGDAQARLLQRQSNSSLALVLRPSADAALAAVLAGEADAAVVDAVSLALFNRGGAGLVAVGEPLRRDPYVVVLPVDAPQLNGAINEALMALNADGTLAAIEAKWLSVTSN
ncbi:MAG: ABC transporter substrate-binding protein [Chloroflexi bacterium]|nr:ABC transporter substrate-binding protein [Chloroflexota bacterium]